MTAVRGDERGFALSGALTLNTLGPLSADVRTFIDAHVGNSLRVELSQVTSLDTSGAVFLRGLPAMAMALGKDLKLTELPEHLRPFFDFVTPPPADAAPISPEKTALERLAERVDEFYYATADFAFLMADLTVFSLQSLYRRKGIRKGSFTEQSHAIGAQALQIVGWILFLIGAVSALQSAAQLRQFGADVFVADMLGIGLTRELGPLMTAIMVSGRSGSAIAAEIATMKFTEELDALQTMAIEPLRFVAVPKMWAMLLCVPLLTFMADLLGILGGTFIGLVSMDIPAGTFLNQVFSALVLKDLLTGLVKSISFAWIITVIAVYRGLNFSGGAAGVGEATTSSVVSSLFGIIVLDAFWGLIFYLKW